MKEFTTNKSQQLQHQQVGEGQLLRRELSALSRAGGNAEGRTTETNVAVSFTVYSSTPETWYKAIGFCLLGLSFHSSHRRGV